MYVYIYVCVCVCVCVFVCCAFVGVDNKLYKKQGTYIKTRHYNLLFYFSMLLIMLG